MSKTRNINRTYEVIKADLVRVKPNYKTKLIKTLPVGTRIKATKIKGYYVYIPKYKGWTIWKSAKGEKYVKLVSDKAKVTKSKQLISALKSIEKTLIKHPIKWSNSPGTSSLSQTLKKNKINCACYISYGLQKIGVLPKNTTFWLDTKIHGKGKNKLKKACYVAYPNKIPKNAGLKKGDICGFSSAPHTMVYAGKDKKGHLLWYSGGGSDVKPKKYGPKRKKSYENRKVRVRLRLK